MNNLISFVINLVLLSNCRMLNSFVLKQFRNSFFQLKAVKLSTAPETYTTFLQHIKNRRVEPAVELFRKMKYDMKNETNLVPQATYSSLFHLFHKAEHIDYAEKIHEEMLNDYNTGNEQSYLALIRCYCDAGNSDKAFDLLNDMLKLPIEPRLRAFHPLIESLCKKERNPYRVIEVLKDLLQRRIVPTSDEIMMLMLSSLQQHAFQNTTFAIEINKMFDTIGFDLAGFTHSEAIQLAAAYQNTTIEDIHNQGVLIDTISSISGTIISNHSNANKSNTDDDQLSILTLNSSYIDESLVSNPSSSSVSEIDSTGSSSSNMPMNPELEDADCELGGYELVSEKYTVSKDPVNAIARIVEINNQTCQCPNCGHPLIQYQLTEAEKINVMLSLQDIIRNVSTFQYENIKTFETWLNQKHEYKYIVDAANCAYLRQNFEKGRFSYRQIELVVEKLKERNDGNILIILPSSYCNYDMIPNRVQNKARRFTQLNNADKAIIEKLNKEHLLYVTTPNINDDWYFLFASVYQKSKLVGVVTNDMIRDHRLAFDSSRTFYRWKSTQIIQFDMTKAVEVDEELSTQDVTLIFPLNFSREIQKSTTPTSSSRYHFPIINKRSWLCLNLNEEEDDVLAS